MFTFKVGDNTIYGFLPTVCFFKLQAKNPTGTESLKGIEYAKEDIHRKKYTTSQIQVSFS